MLTTKELLQGLKEDLERLKKIYFITEDGKKIILRKNDEFYQQNYSLITSKKEISYNKIILLKDFIKEENVKLEIDENHHFFDYNPRRIFGYNMALERLLF